MTSSAACGRTYQTITTFPRLKHSLSWCCYLNANAKRFSCLVFFSTCFHRQWANICVYFHLCLSKFTALVISPTESCTRGQLITLTENSPDQNEKEEGINEGWYEMNYTSPPCNFYELKTRRINSNIFSLSRSLYAFVPRLDVGLSDELCLTLLDACLCLCVWLQMGVRMKLRWCLKSFKRNKAILCAAVVWWCLCERFSSASMPWRDYYPHSDLSSLVSESH